MTFRKNTLLKTTITITMTNPAFEHSPNVEVARILRDLAFRLDMVDLKDEFQRLLNLRDIDGNIVGLFETTRSPDEQPE